jgi:hypothetical protein
VEAEVEDNAEDVGVFLLGILAFSPLFCKLPMTTDVVSAVLKNESLLRIE